MVRPRIFILGIGVGLCGGLGFACFIGSGNFFPRPTAGAAQSAQEQQTWTPDSLRIESWRFVEDFDKDVAVFATVFWDRSDTVSLREWIRSSSLVRGKSVLDIGTGSGLLALCCLQAGAEHVVATDVNRAASIW